jgi:hypothetical protein
MEGSMRTMKPTVAATVALVALFAVAASSAFARTGPRFYVEGSLLGATESIEAQAQGSQVLTATGVEIECSEATGEGFGSIFVSNPGTAEGTAAYTGCTYKGKTAAECEARTKGGGTPGQIKTLALIAELGFKATTGTETVTLVKPKVGTEFVSVEFKGTSCPLTETKVSGSVAIETEAVENVNDVLTAPATAIKQVFNAAGVETKPKLTVTGGFAATYIGKDEVWVTGSNVGKKWGVKE